MSKNKKNAKNDQNTKGYPEKTGNTATDSVPTDDNGSHAENKSDRDCQ